MRKHPLLAFASLIISIGASSLTIAVIGGSSLSSAAVTRVTLARTSDSHGKQPDVVRNHHLAVETTTKSIAAHSSARDVLDLPFDLSGAPQRIVRNLAPTSSRSAVELSVVANQVWQRLRSCESNSNYSADTGNGYYGAYQFALSSWRAIGYTGMPNQAAPSVQDAAARILQARAGWQAWPVCSVMLGLQ